MKIKKLKTPVIEYQIVEKINEIIDLLNKSFITDEPDTITTSVTNCTVSSLNDNMCAELTCDTLIPRANEHTSSELEAKVLSDAVNLETIFDNMIYEVEPNPLTNKKCPHCGESYWSPRDATITAVYYEPIYKDGININPDRNTVSRTYHCWACGKDWKE